jgi:hypothetical protein
MFDLEVKEWIMILAIILGPILAVQIQKILESIKSKKDRRLNLFHTLMSTRATRVSNEHVRALNMIDIHFYGRKVFGVRYQTVAEKSVTNSWKNYNNQLNTPYTDDQFIAWSDKGDDLLNALLYKMSNSLGYDFDEVQLKRDCYRPVAHNNHEREQENLRKSLLEVVEGRKPLHIAQFNSDNYKEGANKSEEPISVTPIIKPNVN